MGYTFLDRSVERFVYDVKYHCTGKTRHIILRFNTELAMGI